MEASRAFAEGKPIIDDQAYDDLKRQLRRDRSTVVAQVPFIEPDQAWAVCSGLRQRWHQSQVAMDVCSASLIHVCLPKLHAHWSVRIMRISGASESAHRTTLSQPCTCCGRRGHAAASAPKTCTATFRSTT